MSKDRETQRTISEPEAWEIAATFSTDIRRILDDRVVAIIVVGSLASGAYTPGRSDIDLVVIVHNDTSEDQINAITDLASRYWEKTGIKKGFGGYGVRLSDLEPPFGRLSEMVFEILQLKHGKLITGSIDLDSIPVPSSIDMKRSLEASVTDIVGAWQRTYPPPIDTRDAQINATLYWLRFLLWDRTGVYHLGKHDAVSAAQDLDELDPIREIVDTVSEYVTEADRHPPADASEICRAVEDRVLSLLDWARVASRREVIK